MARTGKPDVISAERIAATTVIKRVVVPAGGPLSEVGRYRFTGYVPENQIRGECYALVTAIDEREGVMTAQAWQDLNIGTRIQMEVLTFPLDIEWELEERLDPTDASSGRSSSGVSP
jgi:hypothetical protein